MNVCRILFLFIALFYGAALSVAAMPSARKIAPVEVGYVGASDMTMAAGERFIAMLSAPGEKGSDCILFNRRTHRTTILPGSSRMEPLCFSHDGRRLWVWGLHLDEPLPGLRLKPRDRPFIALYDLRRNRYVRALSGGRDDWDVPSSGILSRDERTLIYATEDGWVCGFDTRTGRVMWRRRAQETDGAPVSVALNSDGSKFLRTQDDENGEAHSAQIVSTRSGRVLSTLRLPFASPGAMRSAFSGAVFAPRGNQVAVFQPDTQQWVFFNARTSKVQWKMGGPSHSSEGSLSWQWSPDARLVGVSGPKGFELRQARTGQVLEVCPALQGDALAFSPDGARIYALTNNDTGFGAENTIWQWRLFPTRRQRRADESLMRALQKRAARFAFSPRHINQSLIQAARRGDPTRVALLLHRGANIETSDGRGDSPLANAIWRNDVYGGPKRFYDTAKLLIAHGANARKHGGDLLAGAASKNDGILELLLAHGAAVNGDASHYGTASALHSASEFQQLQNVRILLAHGANPNAHDEEGTTPLMALMNHIDSGFPLPKEALPIARLLLEHGADINARNKYDHSALELTTNTQVKAFLLKAGAKP